MEHRENASPEIASIRTPKHGPTLLGCYGIATAMSSIIPIGNKWRAQVRRKGFPTRTMTHPTKILAEKWAREVEREIDHGRAGQLAPTHVTFGALIDRYSKEVGASKPFGRNKANVLALMKEQLGNVPAAHVTPERIVQYITKDRRIEGVTAGIDLTYMKQVMRVARAVWKVGVVAGAVDDAREMLKLLGRLDKSSERDRRPTPSEIVALRDWFAVRSDTLTVDHIDFILASCFRPPSEIVGLRWADLNEADRTIVIRDRKDPKKKIGNHQTVPLIRGSFDIVMRQPRTGEFIFPVNGATWSTLFPRACDELGIVDLRLYDFRHEAISRLVEENRHSILEMMLITGHKDPKQLNRYTQLKAKNLHRE